MSAADIIDLSPDEVQVWFLRQAEPVGEAALARWRSLLDETERKGEEKRRSERARREYVASRGFLREALSRHAPVDPRAWAFRPRPGGKPVVDAPREARGLSFNLTNTRGLLAVAVARGVEVGVDAEWTRRRNNLPALARRYFHPEEVAAYNAAGEEEEQRRRFFFTWTMKEAYLKAVGVGLTWPLAAFRFLDGKDGSLRLERDRERIPDPDPAAWTLARREVTPGGEHVAALAVRASGMRIRWREWTA